MGAGADLSVPALAEAAARDPAGGAPLALPGFTLPDGRSSGRAALLRPPDAAPFADFRDFTWHRYTVRIVPVMTGRGCQWSRCAFRSDVASASGRSFRTRSVADVLAEPEEQSRRHATRSFLFLDLKLNSWPDMLRGLGEGLPARVPGAGWIGTVHVDERADNGPSRRAAVRGGMRRVSFGLESGSQRLLDAMLKGSFVEANARFARHAHEAGLSVRCTMFRGYPRETADDMRATADFLEAHEPYQDRVRFNEFSLLQDAPVLNELLRSDAPMLQGLRADPRRARMGYRTPAGKDRGCRREKRRALAAVWRINRRPVRSAARQFDGLM